MRICREQYIFHIFSPVKNLNSEARSSGVAAPPTG